MTQRHFAGGSAVSARYAGAQLVRRRFRGETLVWEHPDYPTLDFTGGALPSPSSVPSAGLAQVTYARTGVAYAWAAGSPEPSLVQIAADTPRFSVCPPGVDGDQTGQAMGLLFEPAGQNLLPFGRGSVTGWTSTNITPTTANLDFYTTGTSRILTATANGGLHYRTTPPASQTAKWVFSAWVKRITGMGRVWLTLKSGVEIDISAALANFYIDGSSNHQYAWARVYVAIPGTGPWYGDINTCDRIGFRIDEDGDAIACDALQLEIGDYPTSEILNGTGTLNTRSADRLLIDTNVGGAARKYLLDADTWATDASAAALLWRIRQERHIKRIMIEPNGGNWDIDLQTPAENRPNMGWHDGAPSPVLYSISQPEGLPIRDQVYASGYVIEAATFGSVDFTAPVLSALSATPTAATTADLSVTTDSADGTIYWVVTTVNGTPTVEQMKAGKASNNNNAAYASTTAVGSSGVKTKAATGLAASTTYYLYVLHQDAAGNSSAVGATGSWNTPSAVVTLGTFAANADGWTGDLTITGQPGGAIDFGSYASPKFVIEVTSRSWTTGGVETTRPRTITGTVIKRQAYPNGTLRVETDNGSTVTLPVVLSDPIYAGDTIVSVTIAAGWFTDSGAGGTGSPNVEGVATPANNSALAYPMVIPAWITGDKRHIKSASCVVATTCAHAHAGSGKPVVAVKYIATDQHSHTAEVVVSSMTKYSYTASGLSVPVFEGTLDFSGLDQGDTITIDAVFYPWVGDPYQASVDGAGYPSPNFSVRKCLNDRTGAYGTVYAYVDGVGGGTPAVHTNPATAATTPYSTIAAAASAIQTYNNANFSRNNVSGGIIRLTAAEHVHSSFSARAVGVVPLIIEAANPANRATTVFKDPGSHVFDGLCDLVVFKDLTIKKVGGSVVTFDQASTKTSDHLLRIENCVFDINGTSNYVFYFYDLAKVELVNCSGDEISQTWLGNEPKHVHSIGCSGAGSASTAAYSVIACRINDINNAQFSGAINAAQVSPIGMAMFFSFIGGEGVAVADANISGAAGLALVGCVFERYGASFGALVAVGGGGTLPMENGVMHQCTLVGDRSILAYNDAGSVAVNRYINLRASVVRNLNIKSDYFTPGNGARVGNWRTRYGNGCSYNALTHSDSGGSSAPGYSAWNGEITSRGTVFGSDAAPLARNWTDDRSKDGANTGGGDYRPTAGHAIPLVPAGDVAYPWDLLGQSIPLDGTAVAGACQVAA